LSGRLIGGGQAAATEARHGSRWPFIFLSERLIGESRAAATEVRPWFSLAVHFLD